jgi:hypothetical protein
MEDLGHLRLRDFFFPTGFLGQALDLYSQLSGRRLDPGKVRYYTIQPLVRSLVWLRSMTSDPALNPALALNLAYQVICDRAVCEAIADAMGITLQPPDPLPAPDLGRHPALARSAADNLRRHVLPVLETEWPKSQLAHACLLLDCVDRAAALNPSMERCELDDLAALLGRRPVDVEAGLHDLDHSLAAADGVDDGDVLRYLARRAYRAEQVYAPVVTALFPGRQFTALDL